MPLVEVAADGALRVPDAAVAMLESLGERPLRRSPSRASPHGQVLLLNRFARARRLPHVGRDLQLHEGVWMALDAESGALVLDTEGLGAVDTASDDHDARIFALGMLLSSEFVYNSVGKLDEQALSQLGLVLRFAQRIRSEGATAAATATAPAAPADWSLTWLVRDFALQLLHPDTQAPMTPSEYLEVALREGDHDAAKSSTRATIKQLFRRRACVTAPRPADEERLDRLHELADAELHPKFVAANDALRERVLRRAAPLRVGGGAREVTGPLLARLARQYVDAMNAGAVPSVSSAWAMIVERDNRAAADEAVRAFEMGLDALPADTPPAAHARRAAELEASALAAFAAAALEHDPRHDADVRARLAASGRARRRAPRRSTRCARARR